MRQADALLLVVMLYQIPIVYQPTNQPTNNIYARMSYVGVVLMCTDIDMQKDADDG